MSSTPHTNLSHLDLEAFRGFIQDHYGVVLTGDLQLDGQFHGVGTDQDRHGNKPFRYCVHFDEPQNIYFQDMRRGFEGTWYPQGRGPVDPVERERRRREFEAQRAERARATEEKHRKAATWARALWRKAGPADRAHPYLARKGVGVHGLRQLPVWEKRTYDETGALVTVRVPDALLIPMLDGAGELWNVQAIFPEPCPILARDKDFLANGRKRGLFHWLGRRTETVCLAEGYATGAALYEASGYRVLVCFDAGNLPVVAQTVREAMPEAKIVICADHDKPDRQGRRAGQEKAAKAAALVRGFVALPPVEGFDFNDWRQSLSMGGGHD